MADTSTTSQLASAITARERTLIEAAIESLLPFLDEIDGDADLEDEPLEQEHDGREPEECFEPSLGWTREINQEGAVLDGRDCGDREHDPAELGEFGLDEFAR